MATFLEELWAVHDECHAVFPLTETFDARMACRRDYTERVRAFGPRLRTLPPVERRVAGEHYGIVRDSIESSFRGFYPEDWPAGERTRWLEWAG